MVVFWYSHLSITLFLLLSLTLTTRLRWRGQKQAATIQQWKITSGNRLQFRCACMFAASQNCSSCNILNATSHHSWSKSGKTSYFQHNTKKHHPLTLRLLTVRPVRTKQVVKFKATVARGAREIDWTQHEMSSSLRAWANLRSIRINKSIDSDPPIRW